MANLIILVQFAFLLAFTTSVVQMSLWKMKLRMLVALLLACISYLSFEWLLDFSTKQIDQWIGQNIQLLSTISIAEAMLFFAFSILQLKQESGYRLKKVLRLIRFYPSILLLGGILYFQSKIFYSFDGIEYQYLALAFGLSIFISIGLIPMMLKYAHLPKQLRIELIYLFQIAQFFAGVCMLILSQSQKELVKINEYELAPFIGVCVLTVVLFIVGWIGYKFKDKLQTKWKF
ncbi:hypothetical protein [Sediminitomix flava]|uniref:Uncharacterized protein n=1 Tax=Sediminitomix flava TaxID=379075 RepID=A0A315ZX37_SEDFL|nr:hypothetical protein [Sediminitomix flava]PWJ41887.1 hypothetical protein BC781_103137 [Sediminitomix flava]